MSNWPRNHPDLTKSNYSAQSRSYRAEIDYPVRIPDEPNMFALVFYAVNGLLAFAALFGLLVMFFD
jgi:hypothetical protein